MTKRFSFLLFALLLVTGAVGAQSPIRYQVSLENIQHHELYIRIAFTDLATDTLVVRMPNSSPGRYAEHNFAKNVYEVKAFDAAGQPLLVNRTKPAEWQVPQHGGEVVFAYTLYGNYADGTYTGIDSRKVHMNMPATFAYGVGMPQQPIEISFDLAPVPDWEIATQLKRLSPTTYYAPNYYYFYDSPTLIGDIDFRRWTSQSGGRNDTIEVAMMHQGTDAQLDAYTEWIKKIVEAEKQVWGELPRFDYGRYTFLISYNPWVHGDGMEHRNSTVCSSSASLEEADSSLISTVSHEFFHAWNVERLRPASLEPFDFDRANMSGALWFAEGFTSYYDDLILARAGILPPEKFIRNQEGTFNYVLNMPGRAIRNPVEMSQNAPYVDAASFGDETNFANTYVSYYPYGAVLGYALDLSLRSTFKHVTLDDYMRYLWQQYGKPEKPYELIDLQQALATVTGDAAFAKNFFDQYIYGSKLPDFPALFARFGVEMKPKYPGEVGFGQVSFNYGKTPVLRSTVVRGTPFYQAGVEQGDVVLQINGKAFTTKEEFNALVKDLKVGERYPIRYIQLGQEKEGYFIADADPSWTFRYLPDKQLDKKTRAMREQWIMGKGSKSSY